MLRIEKLQVAIGSVEILRGVSMTVESAQFAGVIGRNGAGKTTLMRSIMGALAAHSGTMALDDRALEHLPAHARARLGVGYMPEDRRLVPALTVEENILLPAWACGFADSSARLKHVYEIVPEVHALRTRKALELSGGQQKLVALGRALLCATRLLLLDEPFEGVAPVLAQRLAQVIASLRKTGLAVMLSESSFAHVHGLLDIVYPIDRGAIGAAT